MARIVDFHYHATPVEYIAEMKKHGIEGNAGFKFRPFYPEKNLKVMKKMGIDKAYLSLSIPGVYVHDDRTAAKITRIVNRNLKRYKEAYPERYGAMAALPFPAKNESVAELKYALDELGFDGVCVLTSANGHYFGEPGHDDLFEEMNKRHAVVFVHPEDTRVEEGVYLSVPPFFERVLETTRCAYNLLINGYMERYPDIRYIFSHGGGGIPMMARRIVTESFHAEGVQPDEKRFEERLNVLRRNFFDTAQRGSSILNGLNAFCGSDQIVVGSDYPYTVTFEFARGMKELQAADIFSDDQKSRITSGHHVAQRLRDQEEVG